TSYPSCNLNFSNLGKLYLQRLYATKPIQTLLIKSIHKVKFNKNYLSYNNLKIILRTKNEKNH
ncbi:hypothetical protein ABTB38_17590, partial [Acinetobacter baumannii]